MLRKISGLFFLLFFVSTSVRSQELSAEKKDSLDYYEMSLEDLLKLKAHGVPSELEELINTLISVSSKKAVNTRETPGIVSLITEEEIKNSGARDLIDVLRMVPGIDFGVDVEGVIGIGMRGNWANEGKILILIDGQETNEILYASSQLGNRFSVELIKRIEVIRGPGSAIYGGYAEYGVINIITKQAEDINGLNASATYGQMTRGYGRKNLNLSVGKKINDFSFGVSGFAGLAQRSDQRYTDFDGASYDMRGNSATETQYINFGAKYKNLSYRLIYDNYVIQARDGFGAVLAEGAVNFGFKNVYSELKHEAKLNDKWKLSSRLNFKYQQPWKNDGFAGSDPYNKVAQRQSGQVNATFDPTRNVSISFGTEAFYDFAKNLGNYYAFKDGKTSVSYYNYTFFTQSLIKTKFTNIILGARFDNHSAFNDAFVPRVGFTKKLDRFHYKLLFGRAFRAPAIENINGANVNGVDPEFTNVVELELGYQMSRNTILTFNIFDINTTMPIVYYTPPDTLSSEYYTNSGASGSKGVEAEYRYKSNWGYITANYAYYTASNKTQIVPNQTPVAASLLAFVNHRVNLNAQANLSKLFSLNISGSYYSKRYHVAGYDSTGNTVFDATDPMFLLNCYLLYKPVKSGLSIGIGVYDI